MKDITDSSKLSEEDYRTIFDSVNDAIFIHDINSGRLLDVNPKAVELLGYSREELTGTQVSDWSAGDPNSVQEEATKRIMAAADGEPQLFEWHVRSKDNRLLWVEVNLKSAVIRGEACVLAVVRDITARKLAQETLHQSEVFLKTIYNGIADALWVMDVTGDDKFIYTMMNRAGERISGIPAEDWRGKTPEEVMQPETAAMVHEHNLECLRSGKIQVYDECLQFPAGTTWAQTKLIPFLDVTGRVYRIVGTAFDITERKQIEQALKDSERKARAIFDQTYQFIGLMSTDGTLLEANRASLKFYGIEERDVIGKPFWDAPWWAHSKELRDLLREATQKAAAGEFVRFEVFHPMPDGTHTVDFSLKPVEDESGQVVFLIPEGRDITDLKRAEQEKRRLQEQLSHAEKMETVGTLAGGVAHDLNNILGAIVGYPDLMLIDIPKGSPLRNSVLAIKESGERAATIVQDLLTLARRGIALTEVVNLNTIISRYIKSREFARLKGFHSTINVETNLSMDLLNILGSPAHLFKVVMNLVSNAAEAMPKGGEILISTQNTYMDKPKTGFEIIAEGDYVLLSVSDDGIGISGQDLEKIFEPFYTKKFMGRSGTGLGMSVVWGTVKDHKGFIDIDSEEGKGSAFRLYFPVSREQVEDEKVFMPVEEYVGHGETILVIDDVKAQQEMASNMLTKLNYTVSAVSSGEEAVEYLKNNSADLLILDMIMDPGMDGLETYKQIVETHPDQKAVITSGFSETDQVKGTQALGAGAYIKKPYTLETIGVAVKKELAKR